MRKSCGDACGIAGVGEPNDVANLPSGAPTLEEEEASDNDDNELAVADDVGGQRCGRARDQMW